MRINLNSVRFRYVLLLLASLILADGIITEYVIQSGTAWEGNPFMRGLLPTGYFMLVKIVGALLVILLLSSIYKQQPKMALVATWLFVLVYTGIVYWNLGGILVTAQSIG
jgi:hypothetical protein